MKKFIGSLIIVLLAITVLTASAGVFTPKVRWAYLEGVNPIENNVIEGLDTLRDWNLKAVFKADVLTLPGLATLGTRLDVSYTPDSSYDDVGVAAEVYVNPFGMRFIELGARHAEQNMNDLDFNSGYFAFFRIGIGL